MNKINDWKTIDIISYIYDKLDLKYTSKYIYEKGNEINLDYYIDEIKLKHINNKELNEFIDYFL